MRIAAERDVRADELNAASDSVQHLRWRVLIKAKGIGHDGHEGHEDEDPSASDRVDPSASDRVPGKGVSDKERSLKAKLSRRSIMGLGIGIGSKKAAVVPELDDLIFFRGKKFKAFDAAFEADGVTPFPVQSNVICSIGEKKTNG